MRGKKGTVPFFFLATALFGCKTVEYSLPLSRPGRQLTVDQIFGPKGLSGSLPGGVKWSPDGKLVTFLKATEKDAEVLDLWAFDVASGKSSVLVAAAELAPEGDKKLSKEEEARRERARVFSKGIVEYSWSPEGRMLLFPLNNDLFVFDLATRKTQQLTKTEEGETDAKFSPDEKLVSFVRKNEIFVVELATGAETQLSSGATEAIWNGVAEFIAQEEMNRRTGYWWSPQSDRIAYTQVDHAKVPEFWISDFSDNRNKPEKQFYPKAGDPNVSVKLGVLSIAQKSTQWMDLGFEPDIYLARVEWLPDGKRLSYQLLNRAQNRLDLFLADPATGAAHSILTENENEWIELHDDLRFFEDGKRFLWSSQRSGRRHLYIGQLDAHANGEGLVPVTFGDWDAISLEHLDEKGERVFFTSNRKSPLEQHLDVAKFGQTPASLTSEEGWHNATMSPDGASYIDQFSNSLRPPCLRIARVADSNFAYLEENPVPELARMDLRPPEFFEFRSAEGLSFHAKMLKPHGFDPAKKYPALVFVYGGPDSQTVKKAWGKERELWHHLLAQKGVVVFTMDGRGTGSRGKDWTRTVHRNLGHFETIDQISGAKYLASLPYVDANRIGIWGWSYGGYMSCMALFQEGTPFRLGIAVAPVTTWRNYDTHYTERFMGLPKENAEGYERSAPLSHAKNLRRRFLLIHGMADDNVHFQDSAMLIEALVKATRPFDMMLYPSKRHSIAGREAQTHLFEKMTDYVLRYL